MSDDMQHIITTSQISKAVMFAKCNHSAETWDALLTLLAAFHIRICEECGGSGVYRAWDFHPDEEPHSGHTCSVCARCDGRRYVISEEAIVSKETKNEFNDKIL